MWGKTRRNPFRHTYSITPLDAANSLDGRRGNPQHHANTPMNELTTQHHSPTPEGGIRALLQGGDFREQVALALPKGIAAQTFVRVALTATTRQAKLLECSKQSFFRCLLDLASVGLLPDGRHAHLIPYGKECTLILDYKGLIALAKRSGEVKAWTAELVCEKDAFSWRDGVVSHEVDWRDQEGRGAIQCVYSRVELADGTLDFEVMTLAEVDAIRKRSKAGQSGPWVTDFGEMAKKTVIRRHSKRLTLSSEFSSALDADDDRPVDLRAARVVPAAKAKPTDPFSPVAGLDGDEILMD